MVKVDGGETIEIDELLREFRQRIDVSADAVREACKDLRVKAVILCGVLQHEDAVTTPNLEFPADFLGWIAELGASLDVDVIL
jgi:hypothetical protein